jgi:hypothetical protein
VFPIHTQLKQDDKRAAFGRGMTSF